MPRVLTDKEVKAGESRRAYLYSSAYTIDNLTAIMMDGNQGGFGLHEDIARAKAHAVLGWMRTIVKVEIPERQEAKDGTQTAQ